MAISFLCALFHQLLEPRGYRRKSLRETLNVLKFPAPKANTLIFVNQRQTANERRDPAGMQKEIADKGFHSC